MRQSRCGVPLVNACSASLKNIHQPQKAVSAATENGDLLKSTDLLFVPIVIEPETEVADEKTVLKSLQVKDPDVEGAAEAAASGYVGLPYLLNEWKALLSDEVLDTRNSPRGSPPKGTPRSPTNADPNANANAGEECDRSGEERSGRKPIHRCVWAAWSNHTRAASRYRCFATGIPNWNALSGDVLQRETFGLDTKNI
eukprot:scaffold3978_cov291-Pinguiococcus_pyrenoidosus.AAC.13